MPAFKPKPGTWSVTPLGWVLFVILAAAAIVAAVGPGAAQGVCLAVIAVVGLTLVGGGMSGRGGARTGKALAARRVEFGPRRRRLSAGAEHSNADDVWLRERARREREKDPEQPAAGSSAEMPDVGL